MIWKVFSNVNDSMALCIQLYWVQVLQINSLMKKWSHLNFDGHIKIVCETTFSEMQTSWEVGN